MILYHLFYFVLFQNECILIHILQFLIYSYLLYMVYALLFENHDIDEIIQSLLNILYFPSFLILLHSFLALNHGEWNPYRGVYLILLTIFFLNFYCFFFDPSKLSFKYNINFIFTIWSATINTDFNDNFFGLFDFINSSKFLLRSSIIITLSSPKEEK